MSNGFVDFFKKIGSWITGLFSHLNTQKVSTVLHQIVTLADQAIPAVELVGALAHNKEVDIVVAALTTLDLTADQILNATDEFAARDMKLSLATQVLIEKAKSIIAAGGKVNIGEEVIDTVEKLLGLPHEVFRSAAQAAYALVTLAK